MQALYRTAGDTYDSPVTIRTATGALPDLTGASVVAYLDQAGAVVATLTATVQSPATNGVVLVEFAADTFDALTLTRLFDMRVVVTDDSVGGIATTYATLAVTEAP